MPTIHKCPDSGAIIFTPTQEEQSVIDLKKDLETMKNSMEEKMKILDSLIHEYQNDSKE